MREKIVISWGGGKDSAMALYEVQRDRQYGVSALLTTLTEDYERVSMHGTRRALLQAQAESIGVPALEMWIARNASNREYQEQMSGLLTRLKQQGVSSVAFGDIFLADLRGYREENLAKIGMKAVFPIWGRETMVLARRFLELGFKAIVICVDTNFLDADFAGTLYDEAFISELPASVDPCGENGEFHTFVYDGPIFRRRVPYEKGATVLRGERFCFCDLIPVDSPHRGVAGGAGAG